MSNDPLDPIRAILDQLAAETEPPCYPVMHFEAHQRAIHDISVYVYPEPNQ